MEQIMNEHLKLKFSDELIEIINLMAKVIPPNEKLIEAAKGFVVIGNQINELVKPILEQLEVHREILKEFSERIKEFFSYDQESVSTISTYLEVERCEYSTSVDVLESCPNAPPIREKIETVFLFLLDITLDELQFTKLYKKGLGIIIGLLFTALFTKFNIIEIIQLIFN